jgi:hypothetical protein
LALDSGSSASRMRRCRGDARGAAFHYRRGESATARNVFDVTGKPIRGGDVTSQILLWDAGAEVSEEPGLGPNQAPLQAAPTPDAPSMAWCGP